MIVAAILAIFIYGMIAALLGTILPVLSSRFRLSPSQNGTIAFAQALGLIIASVAVGPLLDNEGNKLGIVLGLALIALALFLLPRVGGFRGIVALLFLMGIGGGVMVTAANSLASEAGASHKAAAITLANVFFGLGALATPFIAANLFKQNWVRLCYTVASLTIITLLIEALTRMPAPSGAGRFVFAEAGTVLARPLLFLIGLFLFLYVGCEVGFWNWLPRHLIAQGIPEARALNILSLGFALGMLIGRAAVLPVLVRVPASQVTLLCSAAMAVTTFFVLRTRNPTTAWVLVFLAGLAMAPVFPSALSLVGDAFPRMTSTAIGFVTTCGWTGLAVSSRAIGAIAGGDPKRLKTALMVIPVSAALMFGLNFLIQGFLR